MKYTLRSLLSIALFALFTAYTASPALALGDLSESITTSGGLTVQYSDDFVAEEYADTSITLINESSDIHIDLSFGDDVRGAFPDAESAEELMAIAIERLETNGFEFDYDAEDTVELDNGTALIQLCSKDEISAYIVAVDTDSGDLILTLIAFYVTDDDEAAEKLEIGLEITATAHYDSDDAVDDGGEPDFNKIFGGAGLRKQD